MTSISDCVITATKQSCLDSRLEDTRLRRHEVAIQLKGKLHTNYLARKEINETKLTTMNTEKLHDTYKTVATIIQYRNPLTHRGINLD